jgi:hypothetical protein
VEQNIPIGVMVATRRSPNYVFSYDSPALNSLDVGVGALTQGFDFFRSLPPFCRPITCVARSLACS